MASNYEPAAAVPDKLGNGFRLQLTRRKIREWLLKKYYQYYPRNQSQLYQAIKLDEPQIKKLKNVFNKAQYELLLPCNGKTDSSQFDITLLIALLREFCHIKKPQTGWVKEPLETDRSDGANIVRFRIGRNEIQHGELAVSDEKFLKLFTYVSDALKDFGCPQHELDEILTCSLDKKTMKALVQERHALTQERKALSLEKDRIAHLEHCTDSFTFGLIPPLPSFSYREKELNSIHDQLLNLCQGKLGLTITGFGGIGKTELARKYCILNRKTFDNNILWLDAETETSLLHSFQNIAELINLTIKDEHGHSNNIKVVASKVYNFFAKRKLLLIFDNADDNSTIYNFLPQSPNPSHFIIITSQNEKWGQQFAKLKLDIFSNEEASNFLQNNIPKHLNLDQRSEAELLSKLESHPLALQQAVAYITSNGIYVDSYLTLLQSHEEDILCYELQTVSKSISVIKSFKIALEKLQKDDNSKQAIEFLAIMSFLDGKCIKKGLFINVLNGKFYTEHHDRFIINQAMRSLQKYSLVNIHKSTRNSDYNEDTITMHSLVQTAIKYSKSIDKNAAFKKLLKAIFYNGAGEVHMQVLFHGSLEWKIKHFGKYWINHFMYIFHKGNQELLKKAVENQQYLMKIFTAHARISDMIQVLKAMKDLQQKKTSIEIHLYSEINSNIAECLKNQGKYYDALQILQQTEKLQSKILNLDDKYILHVKHQKAMCLYYTGHYAQAIQILKAMLSKSFTNLQGKDNSFPQVLECSLADCLQANGEHDNALKLYRKIEQIYKNNKLGNFNSEYLGLKSKIGLCLHSKGEYDTALKYFKDIEDAQKSLIGTDNPNYINTQHNIAYCLESKGRYDEALNIYKENEKLKLEILGKEHPDYLATKHNIAQCLELKGQYQDALRIYKDVERTQKKVLGSNHPSTILTMTNMANALYEFGEYESALQKLQQKQDIEEERYGMCHQEVLETKELMAMCLIKIRNFNDALQLLKEIKTDSTIINFKEPRGWSINSLIAECMKNITKTKSVKKTSKR